MKTVLRIKHQASNVKHQASSKRRISKMSQEKQSNHPFATVPQGRTTRRGFLRSAVALGLSTPTMAALLAACGGEAPQTPSAGGAATSAPAAGTSGKPASLNMLYATVEADVDAIKLVIPDFKSAVGIDIK